MEMIHTGGAAIPVLGFGTWQVTGAKATNMVTKAIEVGYRHIDTAQIYQNEKEVGKGILNSGIQRKDIFVTTKVWTDHLTDLESFEASVEESLDKLQMDYFDLLLIHWPHTEIPVDIYIDYLGDVLKKGYTRFVGVSNFTVGQLKDALYRRIPIIMNQVEYHPLLDQSKLISFCSSKNIGITAYSPLAQGKVLENETIKEIGAKYGKSPAQISLKWLIQQVNVLSIPRTTSVTHLKSNLDIFDFELSVEDMNTLHVLSKERDRIVNPSFAPAWD